MLCQTSSMYADGRTILFDIRERSSDSMVSQCVDSSIRWTYHWSVFPAWNPERLNAATYYAFIDVALPILLELVRLATRQRDSAPPNYERRAPNLTKSFVVFGSAEDSAVSRCKLRRIILWGIWQEMFTFSSPSTPQDQNTKYLVFMVSWVWWMMVRCGMYVNP